MPFPLLSPRSKLGRAGLRTAAFAFGCAALVASVPGCAAPGAEGAHVTPVSPLSIDDALVRKGATLAAIGNCTSCHTAEHGKAYAGGRPLATPFGTIYATNITPDPETGIGRYSSADFLRAMHEGIARDGRHLYPVFPYDHFALATPADVQAIYAFLMTRAPVQVQVPRNHLPFPVSVRGSVALWNALYLKDGVLQPVPGQSAQWNRGAYLAEALAHCSACHTPRNLLGAEKKALPYAGGEADGWHPPALNRSSAAPTPWTSEQVYTYLRRGSEDAHGLAGGPMAEVVSNLSRVPDDDVRAIAVYIASLSAQPAPIAKARAAEGSSGDAQTVARGQVIYAGACASCHDGGRRGNGALDLSLSTAVAMPTPANLVQIVRNGLTPAAGERGAWMPAFGAAITDAQLADLAAYLREHFAGKPAWKDVAGAAKKVREEQAKLSQASAR